MKLNTDISVVDDPYFEIIRKSDYSVEVRSVNSGDFWKITRSNYGYFILRHRHPGNKDYHYQTALAAFQDCVLEIALHDEYMLRKRRYYVLPEDSMVEKILKS